jgi:hypothetical protein
MGKRDDFPKPVIRTLAERANQRCSNPGCGKPTSGPHSISSKSIIIGVAAHICAAAAGGKRYDPNMTSGQRSAIENGIWLCSGCAKLIDSDEQTYTVELLEKWKVEHEDSVSRELVSPRLVKKEFVEMIPETLELLTQPELIRIQDRMVLKKTEVETGLEYHKVTATDLVRAGLGRNKVHIILNTQDEALEKQNYRFVRFLDTYVDPKWGRVPRTWRALIAAFPIIGEDVGSQSLNDLAQLVVQLHPYLSRELRRSYYSRLRPILIGILADIQAFLQDAAAEGGLSLAITVGAPASWKDFIPWLWGRERNFNIHDSLLQGNWAYTFPEEVIKHNIDISKTWAGFLYDIISRLPDPDRQKGQLLRKYDLMTLTYGWCATAPQDFRPALASITRRPVSSSDHTLAGLYKRLKENADKPAD